MHKIGYARLGFCGGGAALLVVFSAAVWGLVDSDETRDTLAGLNGVCVLVENVNDDAAKDGVNRAQLQTDVELRLRKSGIRVVSVRELEKVPGTPFLMVKVSTAKMDKVMGYAFSIDVDLQQSVKLVRRPNIETIATTWSAGGIIGYTGIDRLEEGVSKFVGQGADRFVNAYLAANPK